MASSFGPASVPKPDNLRQTKGTVIFSYTCVGLTGTALFGVLFFFCYQARNRAAVTAAAVESTLDDERRCRSVDPAKLPEFTYTRSARHSGSDGDHNGAQCSVCLGMLQAGEMVRLLPICKHLYHVECIDMWLASHDTCPLCRSEVLPPENDIEPAATATTTTELPV